MAIRKHCPNCNVTLTLTKLGSSRLWWMSSVLSGRLVQPCAECGTLLRLSSMTLVTGLSSIGFVVASVGLVVTRYPMLLIIALSCAVLLLIGLLFTRVERAPGPLPD